MIPTPKTLIGTLATMALALSMGPGIASGADQRRL
jgi:hypothetical protein